VCVCLCVCAYVCVCVRTIRVLELNVGLRPLISLVLLSFLALPFLDLFKFSLYFLGILGSPLFVRCAYSFQLFLEFALSFTFSLAFFFDALLRLFHRTSMFLPGTV
jgi:hypothetical protein